MRLRHTNINKARKYQKRYRAANMRGDFSLGANLWRLCIKYINKACLLYTSDAADE